MRRLLVLGVFSVILRMAELQVLSRFRYTDIGSCDRQLSVEIFGTFNIPSKTGIVANSFFSDDPPLIRILNVAIVCEVSGALRNTISSFSAVIAYVCSGIPCGRAQSNQILTEQFQVDCSTRTENGLPSFLPGMHLSSLVRTPAAQVNATRDTLLSRECGECTAPNIALPRSTPLDPVSHCLACHKDCIGLGLCLGNGPEHCCNYYHDDNCVVSCPDGLIPSSLFHCGCGDLTIDHDRMQITYSDSQNIGSVATLTCHDSDFEEHQICTDQGWILNGPSITCTPRVFLEYPTAPIAQPVGTQVALRCSVTTNYRVAWVVEIPGIGRFDTDDPTIIYALRVEGFVTAPSSLENRESPLTITGSLSNNKASVHCTGIYVRDAVTRHYGERITIEFYAPPSDLAVVENGPGSLILSWSTATVEGLSFKVNITRLGYFRNTAMEVTGIKGNQYTFTPEFEDSTACDNYMFQVKAVNSAGTETPSEIITRTLPSLPAAPLVPYVIKNPPALEVIVKYTRACPEYPTNSYHLVFEYASRSRPAVTKTYPVTGSTTYLIVDDLQKISLSTMYVMAANQFGESAKSATVDLSSITYLYEPTSPVVTDILIPLIVLLLGIIPSILLLIKYRPRKEYHPSLIEKQEPLDGQVQEEMPGSKGKVPSVQQSVAIEGQIDGSVQAHKSSIEAFSELKAERTSPVTVEEYVLHSVQGKDEDLELDKAPSLQNSSSHDHGSDQEARIHQFVSAGSQGSDQETSVLKSSRAKPQGSDQIANVPKSSSQGSANGSDKRLSQGSVQGQEESNQRSKMSSPVRQQGSDRKSSNRKSRRHSAIAQGSAKKRSSQRSVNGPDKRSSQRSVHGPDKRSSQGSVHGPSQEGQEESNQRSSKRKSRRHSVRAQSLSPVSKQDLTQEDSKRRSSSAKLQRSDQEASFQKLSSAESQETSIHNLSSYGSDQEASQGYANGPHKRLSQESVQGQEDSDQRSRLSSPVRQQGSDRKSSNRKSRRHSARAQTLSPASKQDLVQEDWDQRSSNVEPQRSDNIQKSKSQGSNQKASVLQSSSPKPANVRKSSSQGSANEKKKRLSRRSVHGPDKRLSQESVHGPDKRSSQECVHEPDKRLSQESVHGQEERSRMSSPVRQQGSDRKSSNRKSRRHSVRAQSLSPVSKQDLTQEDSKRRSSSAELRRSDQEASFQKLSSAESQETSIHNNSSSYGSDQEASQGYANGPDKRLSQESVQGQEESNRRSRTSSPVRQQGSDRKSSSRKSRRHSARAQTLSPVSKQDLVQEDWDQRSSNAEPQSIQKSESQGSDQKANVLQSSSPKPANVPKSSSQGSANEKKKRLSRRSVHGPDKRLSQEFVNGPDKRLSQESVHGPDKRLSQESVHGPDKRLSQESVHGQEERSRMSSPVRQQGSDWKSSNRKSRRHSVRAQSLSPVSKQDLVQEDRDQRSSNAEPQRSDQEFSFQKSFSAETSICNSSISESHMSDPEISIEILSSAGSQGSNQVAKLNVPKLSSQGSAKKRLRRRSVHGPDKRLSQGSVQGQEESNQRSRISSPVREQGSDWKSNNGKHSVRGQSLSSVSKQDLVQEDSDQRSSSVDEPQIYARFQKLSSAESQEPKAPDNGPQSLASVQKTFLLRQQGYYGIQKSSSTQSQGSDEEPNVQKSPRKQGLDQEARICAESQRYDGKTPGDDGQQRLDQIAKVQKSSTVHGPDKRLSQGYVEPDKRLSVNETDEIFQGSVSAKNQTPSHDSHYWKLRILSPQGSDQKSRFQRLGQQEEHDSARKLSHFGKQGSAQEDSNQRLSCAKPQTSDCIQESSSAGKAPISSSDGNPLFLARKASLMGSQGYSAKRNPSLVKEQSSRSTTGTEQVSAGISPINYSDANPLFLARKASVMGSQGKPLLINEQSGTTRTGQGSVEIHSRRRGSVQSQGSVHEPDKRLSEVSVQGREESYMRRRISSPVRLQGREDNIVKSGPQEEYSIRQQDRKVSHVGQQISDQEASVRRSSNAELQGKLPPSSSDITPLFLARRASYLVSQWSVKKKALVEKQSEPEEVIPNESEDTV